MSVLNDPAIWFKEFFVSAGFSYSLSSFLSTVALVLIVLFLSWLSNLIAKVVIWFMAAGALKAYPVWLIAVTLNTVKILLEIFEPLLAMLNKFGLKVFQQPSGYDLLSLSKNELVDTYTNNLNHG